MQHCQRFIGLAGVIVLLAHAGALAAPLRKTAASEAASTAATAVNYLVLTDQTTTGRIEPEYFVRNWLVLGPFAYESGKVGGLQDQGAAKIPFVKNEAKLRPRLGTEVAGHKWQRYEIEKALPQYINLDEMFKGPEYVSAYAGCTVYAPKSLKDLILLTGSDDYLTVWIDGREVFLYDKARRKAEPDMDKTKGITLREGANTVVVKCTDVVKHWGFYLRFSDSEGHLMRVLDMPPANP